MAPLGFSMSVNAVPEAGAVCVICTDYIAPGIERISTYIGPSGQSDVCTGCEHEIKALRKRPARVEAVV